MKISPISKSSDLRLVQRATECNQFHVGGYKITLRLLDIKLMVDLGLNKSRGMQNNWARSSP